MNPRSAVLALAAIIVAPSIASSIAWAGEIELPWVKQKTATECGRAVLASVAARHGGNVTMFYRQLPAPPDPRRGYSILELQKFGASVGVNLSLVQPQIAIAGECSERPGLAPYFSQLERLIDAGHPVIVPAGDAAKSGHYLVLFAVNGGNFTALDPSTPDPKKISARELRSMMCGFGYLALEVLD
jgi:ABC-type bacteriocin/lantibiotic exporter with double-glycine peptidase domain